MTTCTAVLLGLVYVLGVITGVIITIVTQD
jgi:hypothetical protein